MEMKVLEPSHAVSDGHVLLTRFYCSVFKAKAEQLSMVWILRQFLNLPLFLGNLEKNSYRKGVRGDPRHSDF